MGEPAVADKILKLMEEQKLSYGELSKITKIPKSALQRYATGTTSNIPINRLALIARALHTTTDFLMGWEPELPKNMEMLPFDPGRVVMRPVVASVRAGYSGEAVEDFQGYAAAYGVKNPQECVWFAVVGDSMSPAIQHGDLALVRRQPDVESGDIAVVIYNGEDGTVKKLQKLESAISLIPLNPNYETKVILGEDLQNVLIYGKVIEIKRQL